MTTERKPVPGSPRPIRLAVVDDHPLVHQGVATLAHLYEDMELVGCAGSAQEGVALILQERPDVALIDLKLPGESGLEVIARVREQAPECRCLVLTSACEGADLRRAMSLKAAGVILKNALPSELVQAIRLVAGGRPYVDPALMAEVLDAGDDDDPLAELTERQREVLAAIARGMDNREIAAALFVSESTVKKHVSEILSKLGLQDRTQAALYGVARGLVRPDELRAVLTGNR